MALEENGGIGMTMPVSPMYGGGYGNGGGFGNGWGGDGFWIILLFILLGGWGNGYSNGGSMRGSYDDGYSRRYSREGSYRRRRDSMGRYSRDGYSGHDDVSMELQELMRNAPDDRTRQKIQSILDRM